MIEVIFFVRSFGLTSSRYKSDTNRDAVHQVEVSLIGNLRIIHTAPDQLHAAAVAGIREYQSLVCIKPSDRLSKCLHSHRCSFRISKVGIEEKKIGHISACVGLWIGIGNYRSVCGDKNHK